MDQGIDLMADFVPGTEVIRIDREQHYLVESYHDWPAVGNHKKEHLVALVPIEESMVKRIYVPAREIRKVEGSRL
jgi:hypothetical protein